MVLRYCRARFFICSGRDTSQLNLNTAGHVPSTDRERSWNSTTAHSPIPKRHRLAYRSSTSPHEHHHSALHAPHPHDLQRISRTARSITACSSCNDGVLLSCIWLLIFELPLQALLAEILGGMAVRDFLSAAMKPLGLCYIRAGMREGQASCVRCNAAGAVCGMEGRLCHTTWERGRYVRQRMLCSCYFTLQLAVRHDDARLESMRRSE